MFDLLKESTSSEKSPLNFPGFNKLLVSLLILFLGLSISWADQCFAATTPTSTPTIPVAQPLPVEFDYKHQDDAFWKKHLSSEVYNICRSKGTEIAFSGKYDKFYEKGTYYCACCGGDHALYSSDTKYDSGTGWPSFYAPISGGIVEQPDKDDVVRGMFGIARTEVICSRCASHLGHVFDDGPKPTGKRYCMNSLALTFVPDGEKPHRTYEIDDSKEGKI